MLQLNRFIKLELSKEEVLALKNQLTSLLRSSLGCSEKSVLNLANFLFEKYEEPHRTYHNLTHIYSLLQLSQQFEIVNRLAFEWAIWYHDAIYNPSFSDNEVQSAKLFKAHFYDSKIAKNFTNEENKKSINDIILSTAGHFPKREHPDILLFLDMDLAILASDWAVYQQYAAAIRQEYSIYADDLYFAGRAKVLQAFLNRKRIYFTPFFEPFEAKARENIKREIRKTAL